MKFFLVFLALLGGSAGAQVACETYGSLINLRTTITAESELRVTGTKLVLQAQGMQSYRFDVLANITKLDANSIEFLFEQVDEQNNVLADGIAGTLLLEQVEDGQRGEVSFTRRPRHRGARNHYELYNCSGKL